MPDVYRYDELPLELRVQIVHILNDAFVDDGGYLFDSDIYKIIVDAILRERGQFKLIEYPTDSRHELLQYFLQEKNTELALDVVELCFRAVDTYVRDRNYRPKLPADDALSELNHRLREAGVGYQFENGLIVRVDSQLVHSDVVKPTLTLLRSKTYENAEQEFLAAHAHYRAGRHQECLTSCAKAFESVMKIICDKRKWNYKQTDTSSKLIEVILSNNLVPQHFQSQFSALRSMLESGIPTIRNKQSAHGQGVVKSQVPDYLASYLLHQTAATILMLVQAERSP